jgi:hypothetical protein
VAGAIANTTVRETYNCISATDNSGNKASKHPKIAYQVLRLTIDRFNAPIEMNNVVNYVKVGRSTVLNLKYIFACSEKKTSTDDMASFTQNKISCATLEDEDKRWPCLNHPFLWPVMRCKRVWLIRAKIAHKLIPDKPSIYH